MAIEFDMSNGARNRSTIDAIGAITECAGLTEKHAAYSVDIHWADKSRERDRRPSPLHLYGNAPRIESSSAEQLFDGVCQILAAEVVEVGLEDEELTRFDVDVETITDEHLQQVGVIGQFGVACPCLLYTSPSPRD